YTTLFRSGGGRGQQQGVADRGRVALAEALEEGEAGRAHAGDHGAPDDPDTEAQVLGEDGEAQILSGGAFSAGFPELGVVGLPVVEPAATLLVRERGRFRMLAGGSGCGGHRRPLDAS